ncbi:DUF3445 domain-containing protein [Shimia sp.]|uniref:heme-dependent oxidative N-demethylase family protein n=1 Tax=Shimia sp. TaxID=1954381 RepID=UPI003297FF40
MDLDDWLIVDDAYAGQMAVREQLLRQNRDLVCALSDQARPAAEELLERVVASLRASDGFVVKSGVVTCPDRRVVALNRGDPLVTIAKLIQEDVCLLQRKEDQHVLTGAVLCFPASWKLSEKIGRPLDGIHAPVDSYDANVARRVQRLFDGVRAECPLWRKNVLWYDDPALFQPRSQSESRQPVGSGDAPYLRSERQSILRLPQTDAVVFSIHTFVLARADAEAAFGPIA